MSDSNDKTRAELQEELYEAEGAICDLARLNLSHNDDSMRRARQKADQIQAQIDRMDDEAASQSIPLGA
jgi:hypothetical protein